MCMFENTIFFENFNQNKLIIVNNKQTKFYINVNLMLLVVSNFHFFQNIGKIKVK